MRILFVTPPLAFQNLGGREIQMLKTRKYLKKLFDLEIDVFDIVNSKISDYEIVHFFGSEYILYPIVDAAKRLHKKVVVSPIFFDTKNPLFYRGAISICQKLPFRSSVLDRFDIFNISDCLLPNSEIELNYIVKSFKILPQKMKVIRNGIDKEKINQILESITFQDESEIKKEFNITTPYFLYVARFDKRKNQLNLIKAFNNLVRIENRVSLILVGSPNLDNIDYYNMCKKEAKESKGRIIFVPALKHNDKKLWVFYKYAFAHIMPSFYETPGLVSLEAAYCGCKLIVTEGGATKEYFEDDALYVNPNNIDDITGKMIMVLKDKTINWDEKIERLKDRINKEYNWESIATKTYEIYKKIGGF